MRLLSVFLFFICVVLISGCGSETELSVEPTMAADESEATPFFNQFMACKAGPEYSEENMRNIITEFNTLNISDQVAWMGGYEPIEGQDTGGWWEVQWMSEEAAEAGWAMWSKDQEAQDWVESSKSILECDGTTLFGYEAYFPALESVALPDFKTYAAAEIPCMFNDGKAEEDLANFVGEFNDWLIKSGSEDKFSYGIYMPTGEDQADFYWFNWFRDFASMDRGSKNWGLNGQEMSAKLNEISTCADPNLYNGAEFYIADTN